LYQFYVNPIVPYSPEKAMLYDEGAMIFVSNGSEVTECRIKRQNTVEMEVKNGMIDDQKLDVEDGLWECAWTKKKWIPLRQRLGKIASTRLVEKLILHPELHALMTCKHKISTFDYDNIWRLSGSTYSKEKRQEGFFEDDDGWHYGYRWTQRIGEVNERKFYFKVLLPGKVHMKGKKHAVIEPQERLCYTTTYIMITPTEALVQGGVRVEEVPAKDSSVGAAVLSLVANDVGVVIEGGKLYTLPGGKTEKGETPMDTVQRELNEEIPPGWGSVKTIGPYVSDGCTYFVTHDRVSGLNYVAPQSLTVHPYVRRVIEHYQQSDHYHGRCFEISFF